MALMKDGKYGTKEGNYWRVIALHANTLYNQTIARIALYVSREEREKDEANYLMVTPMILKGVDYTRENAYKAIKEQGYFDGATDC